jgi:hypothetical protein
MKDTDENQHYRIRLLTRGKVEVFTYVHSHRVFMEHGSLRCIEITYGKDSPGSSTVSQRPLELVYDIQILEKPREDYGEHWQGPTTAVAIEIH